jgi:hypothetical protein
MVDLPQTNRITFPANIMNRGQVSSALPDISQDFLSCSEKKQQ